MDNNTIATEILKGYKKQFTVTVAVLSAIIAVLLGYIFYDAYNDSLYETIEYVQDGSGNNNMNVDVGGDVYNGAETENQTEEVGEN